MKRIRVIGVGGAGLNTVYRLAERGFSDAELFAVDVDRYINIDSGEFYNKVRAMLSPEHVLIIDAIENVDILTEELIKENRGRLLRFVEGADAVVLVGGLGGFTGGPVVRALCEMAKENDLPVATVLIIPFSVEEKGNRADRALKQAREISEVSDIVMVLKNDFLLKVAPKEPLNVAFGFFDEPVTWVVAYLRKIIR